MCRLNDASEQYGRANRQYPQGHPARDAILSLWVEEMLYQNASKMRDEYIRDTTKRIIKHQTHR